MAPAELENDAACAPRSSTWRLLATVAAARGPDLLVMAQREVGTDIVRTLVRTATEAGIRVTVLAPLIELPRPSATLHTRLETSR
jgi:hypothetical protein